MRRIAIAVIAALALSACCPKHYQPQVVYRDSVRVEIRERLVYDTVKVEVPKVVERIVTRDTSSHLENDWAMSDASVSDGFLSHSLETKPHTVYVPVAVPVHDTTYIEKEAQETVIEKEVEKPLSRWKSFKLAAFWWLILVTLVELGWIFRKPLLKLMSLP